MHLEISNRRLDHRRSLGVLPSRRSRSGSELPRLTVPDTPARAMRRAGATVLKMASRLRVGSVPGHDVIASRINKYFYGLFSEIARNNGNPKVLTLKS